MLIYTVQPGDTVFRIAAQTGVSPQDIIDQNGLTAPFSLSVGQALLLLYPQELYTCLLYTSCNEETEFLAYCLFTLLVFSAMIVYHKETTSKAVSYTHL